MQMCLLWLFIAGYLSRERVLPDLGMLHGRLLVTAWDFGLEDVTDTAVKLLLQAVHQQLKNILAVVLARRSAYKLREKHFRYAVGSPHPLSTLRNTALLEDTTEERQAPCKHS